MNLNYKLINNDCMKILPTIKSGGGRSNPY